MSDLLREPAGTASKLDNGVSGLKLGRPETLRLDRITRAAAWARKFRRRRCQWWGVSAKTRRAGWADTCSMPLRK